MFVVLRDNFNLMQGILHDRNGLEMRIDHVWTVSIMYIEDNIVADTNMMENMVLFAKIDPGFEGGNRRGESVHYGNPDQQKSR